jgi:hypothetical protein
MKESECYIIDINHENTFIKEVIIFRLSCLRSRIINWIIWYIKFQACKTKWIINHKLWNKVNDNEYAEYLGDLLIKTHENMRKIFEFINEEHFKFHLF